MRRGPRRLTPWATLLRPCRGWERGVRIGGRLERIPLLLDTDIGTNVDDALALLYLLRQPRCELLGVTTVSGDVRRRAACAEAVCEDAGRADVPVRPGAPGP